MCESKTSFRRSPLSRSRTFAPSHVQLRTERFGHGAFAVEMVLPRAADELIDVSEFNRDERLPYWADLWPSARGLTRHLLDGPVPPGRIVELGCGVALPSLALRWRGVPVLATDYYEEALEFARRNAEENGIPAPDTLLVDWRTPPRGLGLFDLVLAADVLYEKRNAEALVGLLPRVVAPGGRALVADPGRLYFADFRAGMEGLGWRVREVEVREEPSGVGEGSVIRVSIVELQRDPKL